jgi:peptide/nickel transport system substrate-binding protein
MNSNHLRIDRRVLTAAMLLLLGSTVACRGAKGQELERQARPQADTSTLMIAREEGANSLDIHGVGTNRPAYGTSWNVYDRLVTYGKKTSPDGQAMYDFQKLEPELAERWEIDPQKRFITFHLRRDAKFHDGTTVTAADVKWSFDRALAIGGFPTFQMKAGSLEKPEQFEVVDPLTFRVHLLRDDRLTLPDIGVPVAAIYNSTLAKSHATGDDPWAQAWLKNSSAGGGAYRIKTFEPGVQEVYERFDDWKSGPMPKIRRVIVRVVPSAATRRAMIERGDVDLSFDLPPRDFAELARQKGLKVQGVAVENFMWFADMNVKQPPFDKLEVRQAVAAALPYEEMFAASCFGRGRKLFGAASDEPSDIEWPQPYPNRTDLEKAKALLARAGLPNGFKTKLYYNLGLATVAEPAALLAQQGLRKIGIEVELEKVPAANWRAEMGKKSMPFLLNDMGGWLNYADYFFFWNYHGQNAVFNTMSYQSQEMDRHIDAARFATDPAEYDRSVKAFIGQAFRDTPRIPLFQSNLDVAMKPNVLGYTYWFHRQIDFRQIWRD